MTKEKFKHRVIVRLSVLVGFLLGALQAHFTSVGWTVAVFAYGVGIVVIFTVRDFYIQRV